MPNKRLLERQKTPRKRGQARDAKIKSYDSTTDRSTNLNSFSNRWTAQQVELFVSGEKDERKI
jgi:hypothetical protein